MKILIVTNMYPGRNFDFEYAGIFVKEQLEALSKVDNTECQLYIIDGFKSKLNYLFSSLKLLFLLVFKRYDIIHVHYGLSALFILLNPFKRKWNNVVLTLHGGDILVSQGKRVQVWLTKKIIPRVGAVLTLNEEMNEVVSEIRKDYMVLPCGVHPLFLEKDINGKRNINVLFPGRSDREVKNYPFFEAVIERYIVKYGSIKPVILDGYTREEVSDLMISSSVMLMTSISEGSPQAIKEALGSDLPIVSSDVGDVKDVLNSVPGTYIYQSSDAADKVADLLHRAIVEGTDSVGKRKQRIIDLGLSNDQVVLKLFNVYRKLISVE